MSKTTRLLKTVRTELDRTETYLKTLETDYSATHNKHTLADINAHLQKFNDLATKEQQYMATPIRACRYGEGNRAGHHLARLLRNEHNYTPIASILTGEGIAVHGEEEMNAEFTEY